MCTSFISTCSQRRARLFERRRGASSGLLTQGNCDVFIADMQSSSLKLFSSFEQKAMLLKRQAFAVFSGELDQYHLYLPLIQGKAPACRRPSTGIHSEQEVFVHSSGAGGSRADRLAAVKASCHVRPEDKRKRDQTCPFILMWVHILTWT